MEGFNDALGRVLTCTGAAGSICPDWWREIEDEWRRNATAGLSARLTRHASEWGDFLPKSKPATFKKMRRKVAQAQKPWPILEYWGAELSCGAASQRVGASKRFTDHYHPTIAEDGKWLCGSRRADLPQPCTVLAVGSNFDDSFERALSRLAGCRSLVVDPTLGPEDSPHVRRFAASLAQYGSHLNASVGIGVGTIVDRNGTRHALRPFAQLVANGAGFFTGKHLSVAKIDAEGGEFAGGLLGREGLWSLCASGALSVDQVLVEVHVRSAGNLANLNAIFEGASRCGMVLLHKEINWAGCHRGGCFEVAWASLRHIRRVAERERRRAGRQG